MPLTLDSLKELLNSQQLRYFVAPDRSALMLSVSGLFGHYQFVIHLDCDGMFLQFRTVNYAYCRPDHRHLAEMLKVLAAVNFRTRLVKFAWDASDGEIVAYADLWVVDGTVTQAQFQRMLYNFMPVIDMTHARLEKTLQTGADPGEEDPAAIAQKMAGDRGLPSTLRKLLDQLSGKKDKQEADYSTI